MFVISTRNFPPDVGGIQNLIEGLSNSLLNHGPVTVFADNHENYEQYDKQSSLDIVRVHGFKIFRKYRKANLIHDFLKSNQVRALFFDHWKSIENIDINHLNNITSFCLIHSKEINHPVGSLLNKRMCKSLNKAKQAKKEAIKAFLEAKKIKEEYILDDLDSSDVEDLEEFSE